MPMNAATTSDERSQLLAFLAQQRAAAANAAYGLDEAGARRTPTGSELSVGGLVKHLASGERQWTSHLTGADPAMTFETYLASFHLEAGDTLPGLLEDYRVACAATDAAVAAELDMGRVVPLPPQPWMPEGTCTVRWVVLHLIEETARHAGHMDVIRQTHDGAQAGPLMAAVEGWPADGWITPWAPAATRP